MIKTLFSIMLLLLLSNMTFSQIRENKSNLDSLKKRVELLRTKIELLTSKIPFESMSVQTVVCGPANTISEDEHGFTWYHHEIKIDDPLCNNNPRAIIFAIKQKGKTEYLLDSKHTESVGVYYNRHDNFWYITLPSWQLRGFAQNITVKIATERGGGHEVGDVYFFKSEYYHSPNFPESNGVAYFGAKPVYEGEKYSVIIFKEMPSTRKDRR